MGESVDRDKARPWGLPSHTLPAPGQRFAFSWGGNDAVGPFERAPGQHFPQVNSLVIKAWAEEHGPVTQRE